MAKKKNDTSDQSEGDKIEVRSAPKVNDVAKPGSTAASPTSRPIITNHSSIIKQDPMVSGGEDSSDDTEKSETDKENNSKSKSKIKIAPLNEGLKTDKGEVDKKEAVEPEPPLAEKNLEEKLPDDSEDAESQKIIAEEPVEEDSENSDSGAIETLAKSADNKKSSKQAQEEEARQEKVKELIASKKYNANIVEGGHKATSQKFATWILIFLVLCSAAVYLAIDAGYLDIGVDLPYEIIKN